MTDDMGTSLRSMALEPVSKPSVTLVQLPFTPVRWPSVGLGYLSATLRANDIPTQVVDLNLDCFECLSKVIPDLNLYKWEMLDYSHPGHYLCSHLLWPDSMQGREDIWQQVIKRYCFDIDEAAYVLDRCLTKWIESPWVASVKVIGISLLNTQLLPGMLLARAIKRKRSDIHTVIGGFMCTQSGGESLLIAEPAFDVAVFGEGEHTLLEMMEVGPQNWINSNIPGTVVRTEKGIASAAPRTPMTGTQLDALPFPDFSWIQQRDIQAYAMELPILSSRGCYWGKCSFCSDAIHWPNTNCRSADNVASELQYQAFRYNCFKFYFCDLAANTQPGRISAICSAIAKRGLSLEMTILLRPEKDVDRELLTQMKKCGFRCIQFGMESFNTNLLRKMKKGITALDNIRLLRISAEVGVTVKSNIITHYPGETEAEVSTILALVQSYPHLFNRESISSLYKFRLRSSAPIENEEICDSYVKEDGTLSLRLLPIKLRDLIPVLEYRVKPKSANKAKLDALWQKINKCIVKSCDPKMIPRWYGTPRKLIIRVWDIKTKRQQTLKLDEELSLLLLLLDYIEQEWKLCSELSWNIATLKEALALLRDFRLIVSDGTRHLSVVLPGALAAVPKSKKKEPNDNLY